MGNIGLELLLIAGLCSCYVASFRDQQYSLHGHPNVRCVDIPQNLSLCHSIGYTQMRLPNLLEQETLDEVSQQSAFWLPLLASRCNSNTRLFLCSLFSPVCLDQPVYPCRSLCESVRDDCEPRMARFGFPWPGMFACDQFPVDNQLCIGQINLEENEEAVKVTKESLDDMVKEGGGFGLGAIGREKPPRPVRKGKGDRKRKADANGTRENHKKNYTEEALKKDEVIRTLELICKADFAAQIKPTGIYSMEGSGESRITSKKVVFYKTDDAVPRMAKSHPSDFGPPHQQRYYFYVEDELLAKLSQRNFHPSFKDESSEGGRPAPGNGTPPSPDAARAYKIHKNDQLLVAGSKTSGLGKQNRLVLSLIMHMDEESPFVRKIIKMFKESNDFCSEAEELKDPVHGDKMVKKFISAGNKKNKDKPNKGKKKHKMNHRADNRSKKKDKHNSDGGHSRRNKDKKSEGNAKAHVEPTTTRRIRKASGLRNPMRGVLRSSDDE